MDSLITTFHIDWKLIVAQLVNFAVVFFVLYWFALKPLKSLMDERGKTIQGGLDNAEKQKNLLAEAHKVLEDGQIQLKMLAVEQKKNLAVELEQQKSAAMEETKATVDKMFKDGKTQMEIEKNKILEAASKEVGSLLVMLAEKAFGENMDSKMREKLAEQGIKNI